MLIIVGLVIGGMKIMQQVQYNEMVNTVKSEEVKNIIENNLKLRHEDALKSGDVIQSYQIWIPLNIVQWVGLSLKFILIMINSYMFIF